MMSYDFGVMRNERDAVIPKTNLLMSLSQHQSLLESTRGAYMVMAIRMQLPAEDPPTKCEGACFELSYVKLLTVLHIMLVLLRAELFHPVDTQDGPRPV